MNSRESHDDVRDDLLRYPTYLGLKEVSRLSGVKRSSIYKHLSLGTLRAVKIGRRTLVRSDELTRWLDSMPAAPFSAED